MTELLRFVAAFVAAALVGLAATAGTASAWQGSGAGSAYAGSTSLAAGAQPTATVSGRDVTVEWEASGIPSGPPASSYTLRRYDAASGVESSPGGDCAGAIAGTSCVDRDVDPGSWRYGVIPRYAGWSGGEGPLSSVAAVDPPSLTLSPAEVEELPRELTGGIASFLAGQTVSFRLDDPTAGQLLSGSITPDPVPGDGTAAVSVTLPAGVANGPHTVYALGDGGDEASAAIDVSVPCATPEQRVQAASADSYVDEKEPGTNYGGSTDLYVASRRGGKNQRTLVAFELPPLPAGCELLGAQLRLFSSGADPGRTLLAQRAGSAWSESAVTWDTQPGVVGTPALATSGTGWVSWEVTAQVQAMYSGANHGFVVRDELESSAPPSEQVFVGRAGTSPPELVLELG